MDEGVIDVDVDIMDVDVKNDVEERGNDDRDERGF